MDILPGMDFAQTYHILEEVGRGRLGTVYKAFDSANARYVALRVLPPTLSERTGIRPLFESLAAAWTGLHHPHIQEVYAYGQEEDVLYLAGEFIEGGSLAAHVGTPISMSFTVRALTPIANALDFAHAQGVLHRDVKPANVMVSREGRSVLVDVGVAQLLEGPAGQSANQTGAGVLVGTPAYMAPEHATGKEIGAAADRYSLAVVAYEMLTGSVPFTADTPIAVMLAHASKPLPPPQSIYPAIPSTVSDVLQTALAKESVNRYPTAGVFLAELEEAGRAVAPGSGDAVTTSGAASGSNGSTGAAASVSPAPQGTSGTRIPKTPARSRGDGGGRSKGEDTLPERLDAVRTRVALSLTKGLVRLRSRAPLPVLIGALVVLLLVVVGGAKLLAGSSPSPQPTPLPTSTTPPAATTVPSATTGAQSTATTSIQPTTTVAPTQVHNNALGPGSWAASNNLQMGRATHQAVALQDGRVLVIGGLTNNGPSADAEIYDPAKHTWSSAGTMQSARVLFTATLLNDGKVLVAGGNGGENDWSSAELFDPKTGKWTATGDMQTARDQHTATLLKDGRVLVAGGETSGASPINQAEIYDPATGKWTPTAPMRRPHWDSAAVRLNDGRVLVAGGGGSSVEIYDPISGHWTQTRSMANIRYRHTATLLHDGRVLVVGGERAFNDLVASAEWYDPTTQQWTATASPAVPHSRHTATLLPDGRVLILGGASGTDAQVSTESGIKTAELYDPASGTWSSAGDMQSQRAEQTASLLPDGRVLVVGGFADQGTVTDSTELYSPASGH